MKKTTIYLEDYELEVLKNKAFLLKTSVADLIRKGIKQIMQHTSKEEDTALTAIANIRKKASGLKLDDEIIALQREVRNEKKNKSRN